MSAYQPEFGRLSEVAITTVSGEHKQCFLADGVKRRRLILGYLLTILHHAERSGCVLTTTKVKGNGTVPVRSRVTLDERTPGETFAAELSAAANTDDLTVPFSLHLPEAFPLFASRPRYTVRHLLKTMNVPDRPATYVYEPPRGTLTTSGTTYAATPEAAFAPRLAGAALTDLTVSVPLPNGITEHAELLASFIDFRVLVRLSVLENQSLLHGSPDGAIEGLLKLPDTRRSRSTADDDDLETTIVAAAADVEETGGSCDGVVAHPVVYWELVRTGALSRLQVAGITVSRTRMMPRDRLLLGDFRAALTLLLPGIASITLRRATERGLPDTAEASTRIGLAVHLPQHLLTVAWGSHD